MTACTYCSAPAGPGSRCENCGAPQTAPPRKPNARTWTDEETAAAREASRQQLGGQWRPRPLRGDLRIGAEPSVQAREQLERREARKAAKAARKPASPPTAQELADGDAERIAELDGDN